MACVSAVSLVDVFTEKQMRSIVERSLGSNSAQIIACDKRPATTGLAGFLGDHFRVTIHAKVDGVVKKIRLFVKTLPATNRPKADFIDKNGYFRREMIALRLSAEMRGAEGPNPWCARVYLCNESTLVMPDLAIEGYTTFKSCETLDLKHILVTTASIARFHASFTNYATARSSNNFPYIFLREYGDVVTEPTFCDSPWLRAAAKLSANFLRVYSKQFARYPQDLERTLVERYIEACATLTEHEGTLNVMIHKDLWVNNIMFKHNAQVEPINALLIDFQCLRYGPPAFDLMIFLYLTTVREYREQHERDIIRYYFDTFSQSTDDATKKRLKELSYDYQAFADWCEKSRMFALFMAIGIFPYILMDPTTAQKTFDDPDTYMKYCDEDRTQPVLEYSKISKIYMKRQLEVNEEFVERYVLNRSL